MNVAPQLSPQANCGVTMEFNFMKTKLNLLKGRSQALLICTVGLGLGASLSLAAATFSDANWMSLNPSIPGADQDVSAAVVDGSGNLYIGGRFTFVGGGFAYRIAKWNGSNWSP